MKDSELQFDRGCHVLYSRQCRKEMREKIALHYPETEREAVWERVQRQYAAFLSDWRTDLGGRKNFHNGKGGTYDCIALMSYYVVCRAVTSFREIEEMEEKLRGRGLRPYFITGHTGWTEDFDFAFAHREALCSPFKKKVHDPSAPYDAYDESDDTEEKAKSRLLPPVRQDRGGRA